ncbi:hypothetical protein K474DRAFT_1680725 [Panus rudis PR-1116 ss-1]|nr:hypothetical protein K474DRAFT_1680725 [Panus rudis PR-1116 ss-1]
MSSRRYTNSPSHSITRVYARSTTSAFSSQSTLVPYNEHHRQPLPGLNVSQTFANSTVNHVYRMKYCGRNTGIEETHWFYGAPSQADDGERFTGVVLGHVGNSRSEFCTIHPPAASLAPYNPADDLFAFLFQQERTVLFRDGISQVSKIYDLSSRILVTTDDKVCKATHKKLREAICYLMSKFVKNGPKDMVSDILAQSFPHVAQSEWEEEAIVAHILAQFPDQVYERSPANERSEGARGRHPGRLDLAEVSSDLHRRYNLPSHDVPRSRSRTFKEASVGNTLVRMVYYSRAERSNLCDYITNIIDNLKQQQFRSSLSL